MVHEKRLEVRWRDVDAYRHVNNAVYAEELVKLDGTVAAESEPVLVVRDRAEGGRSRPLTDAERQAFEAVLVEA